MRKYVCHVRQIRESWHKQRSVSCTLPFASCFNSGAGKALFSQGVSVKEGSWYNLSAQHVLPLQTVKVSK